MNGRRMRIVNGSENAASGIATPNRLSSIPSRCSNRNSGRAAALAGNSRPVMKKTKSASRPRNEYRDSANEAIAPNPTDRPVATTATSAVLPRDCQKNDELRTER